MQFCRFCNGKVAGNEGNVVGNVWERVLKIY
jgi:hypothetical protein